MGPFDFEITRVDCIGNVKNNDKLHDKSLQKLTQRNLICFVTSIFFAMTLDGEPSLPRTKTLRNTCERLYYSQRCWRISSCNGLKLENLKDTLAVSLFLELKLDSCL